MTPDGCTVPPRDAELAERDYLAEARAIAAGQSRLMAHAEHLKAVLALAAQQAGNVQQLSEIVAAFMVERQTPAVLVPADALDQVRLRKLQLFVERTDAGVKVRATVPLPTTPTIHG